MPRRRRRGRRPESLLQAAREDPGAFRDFYEQHATGVFAFHARRVLDPETALDLTSETFAEALDGCDGFRGTTQSEEAAWLYAIARAQLAGFWRQGAVHRRAMAKVGVDPPHMTTAEIEQLEDLVDFTALRPQLRAALDVLPADQRDAVALRVIAELDYADVAEETGVTEQVARARVSRGLRRLAVELRSRDSVDDDGHTDASATDAARHAQATEKART